MSVYQITVTACAGENPVDAFEKLIPGRTLEPVKDGKHAQVRVELLKGSRKSVGYYRSVVKPAPKPKASAPVTAKQKANKTAWRIEREQVVMDLLQSDRHPLEAFVDMDYFRAGPDACWEAAREKLEKMSDYALGIIAERIAGEDYSDYAMLFCVIE